MATWGYVRPEKQTVGNQHRGAATVAKTVAKPLNSTRRTWTTLEYRPSLRPVTDGPGRCAHSYGSEGQGHAGGSAGGLPRTRRRSVHASRNLSRAPAASLRDRLRRPWTEPVCRQVRQQSGSGEGSGQDRVRSRRREDLGDGEQDQRLTATVTATAAATGYQQRPATAHNTRTICANWGYVRPEKRKVGSSMLPVTTTHKRFPVL